MVGLTWHSAGMVLSNESGSRHFTGRILPLDLKLEVKRFPYGYKVQKPPFEGLLRI